MFDRADLWCVGTCVSNCVMRDQVPRKCGHCDGLFQRPRWSLLHNFPAECSSALVEQYPRMINYLQLSSVRHSSSGTSTPRTRSTFDAPGRSPCGRGCVYGEAGRFVEDRTTRVYVSWRHGLTYLVSLRVSKASFFTIGGEEDPACRSMGDICSCVLYVKPHGGVWP